MAVLKKTYIDGDLKLQSTTDDSGSVILNPSYKIGGTIFKDDKNNYKIELDPSRGTKYLTDIQNELSTLLGRTEKLSLHYWCETLKYDCVPPKDYSKFKDYFVMTFEENDKGEIIQPKVANISAYLMGDSVRIYGRLKYKGSKEDLDGNFRNKIMLRVRINNQNNYIKCIHKASGQIAGYGNVASVYVDNVPVGSHIALGVPKSATDPTKVYSYGSFRLATNSEIIDLETARAEVQVNRPGVTSMMMSTKDPANPTYNPIWLDVKLSAVTNPTSEISFYINCPVELNEQNIRWEEEED